MLPVTLQILVFFLLLHPDPRSWCKNTGPRGQQPSETHPRNVCGGGLCGKINLPRHLCAHLLSPQYGIGSWLEVGLPLYLCSPQDWCSICTQWLLFEWILPTWKGVYCVGWCFYIKKECHWEEWKDYDVLKIAGPPRADQGPSKTREWRGPRAF